MARGIYKSRNTLLAGREFFMTLRGIMPDDARVSADHDFVGADHPQHLAGLFVQQV